ncbi:MAG: transglutaminase domain-containing protein [Bacteroidia bacterium]
MKKILIIGIYFCSSAINAQEINGSKTNNTVSQNDININNTNYSEVDNYVLAMKQKYYSIPDLSKVLTVNFKTEEEKVRAIFRWITENIAYDCKAFHTGYSTACPDKDDNLSRKDYYYQYAENILKSKKAVCEGYSFLFYELCKEAGIKCYVVCGLTSSHPAVVKFFRNLKAFDTDHAWNKVMVDGKWYFVDATWASGSCNRMVTHFKKKFNPDYYLTPLNMLYSTHAEEKTESADFNDIINNYHYPEHKKRRPFLNIFYCRDC